MSETNCTVRLPYAERFRTHGYRVNAGQQFEPTVFEEHPEIPETLMTVADMSLTAYDLELLRTDEPGSPLSGYAYNSEPRRWLVTQQKAAMRIREDRPAVYASLAAREVLKQHVLVTPLVQMDEHLALKLENRQYQKSFKVRGAGFAIAKLLTTERPEGLVAVSTGNHAQGVALAAQRHDLEAVIYMPETTPEVKQAAARELGAKIELVGEGYSEASTAADAFLSHNGGYSFIHPFNDPAVIRGQGTIAAELLAQTKDIKRIYVGIGGGGAISGIGQVLKEHNPDIQVIGVQLAGSDAMKQSRDAGRLITLDEVNLFSDGTAVKRVGELTLAGVQKYVDRIVTVTDKQLLAAMAQYHAFARKSLSEADYVEAAGALPLAAYMQETNKVDGLSVAVATGGNIREEHKALVDRLVA